MQLVDVSRVEIVVVIVAECMQRAMQYVNTQLKEALE